MSSAEYKIKVIFIRPNRLILAEYNPPQRTERERGKIDKLAKLIEQEGGLRIPILITSHKHVIDGHRRIAAYKLLQTWYPEDERWDTIPAIMIRTTDPERTYAAVNAGARRMGGPELIYIWLRKPSAVPDYVQRELSRYEELFGRDLIEEVCDEEMSKYVFSTAICICNYLQMHHRTHINFARQTVKWLVLNRQNDLVRSYIKCKGDPIILQRLISNNMKLNHKIKKMELRF